MKEIIIPEALSNLSTLSKHELVASLGADPFREVVVDICLGLNVRDFTETLTRKRIVQSNAALWEFFCSNKRQGISPFDLIEIASTKLLKGKVKRKEKPVYQWLTGLTNKGVQNVLRKSENRADFDSLTGNTLEMLKAEAVGKTEEQYLKITTDTEVAFSSEELLWILFVIGSQTATIRGSEKSLHGKYFEKLILGSVFQIFGLELLEEKNVIRNGFWLSSEDSDRRESDCTIVYNSKGIRVDIGFIGSGNSEITLDKVSRYRKYDEIAGESHEMSTIVIVDTIGENSKVRKLAEDIEGAIVCMSDKNWVSQLSQLVSNRLNIEDLLADITTHEELECFFRKKIEPIDLEELINM